MYFRRTLLVGTSALALNAALTGAIVLTPTPAEAACLTVSGNDGTISGSISCVTWEGSNATITSGGTVTGAATAVSITSGSVAGTLTNSGTLTGTTDGLNDNHGTVGTIINGKLLNGIIGIYDDGGIIGSIINSGSLSGSNSGILDGTTAHSTVASTIGAITNTGTISGGVDFGISVYGGTIGTITNSGTIKGTSAVLLSSGSIGVIINNSGGSISATGVNGIASAGTIGSIVNNVGGVISGGSYTGGIANYGILGAITNSGKITDPLAIGIYNNTGAGGGTVSTIANNSGATINGGYWGIDNNGGSIGTIANSGTISGGGTIGIDNDATGGIPAATIGTITNSGLITGGSIGIDNGSSIGSAANRIGAITNSGSIGGGKTGIYNHDATIGTISNGGIISGPLAITSNGTGTILSALTNTGTISGKINANQNLTITGGNPGTLGTLTGFGTVTGTITASNVLFDNNAYQLLNDNVSVASGSGTVTNEGVVKIGPTSAPTITGNFNQGSGAVLFVGETSASQYGVLTVTDNATLAGSSVSISGATIAGEAFTIVKDSTIGAADYAGVTGTIRGFTTSITSIASGGFEDLIVTAASTNCAVVSGSGSSFGNAACILWNGGSISVGSLGTISGAATGVINAGSSVGTLTNAGIINGSVTGIYNASGIGTIAAIVNTGTITGGTWGINNNTLGAIDGIFNGTTHGTVATSISGITNSGTIGISTGNTGVANYGSATIGTIANSGVISAKVDGINNSGVIGTITNSSNIGGGTAGILNGTAAHGTVASKIGAITNSGTIGISTGNTGIVNYGIANIDTIANSGVISAQRAGINSSGSIGTITNSIGGTISGGGYGISNYTGGSIGAITNSIGGTISSSGLAVYNYGGGSIGSFSNNGAVIGTENGITNQGYVGDIFNSGVVKGNTLVGLANWGGSIAAITNSGTITGAYGVYNGFTVSTLANSGLINGASDYGIDNYSNATIGIIENTGSINGSSSGIYNSTSGTIGSILNSISGSITGTVSGGKTGLYNAGTIASATNSGLITGGSIGIDNNIGTIGTIANNSGGTISGRTALVNGTGMGSAANIGVLSNNGVIAGTGASASGIVNFTDATIGALINNSGGTIDGAFAGIWSPGSIGTINNSGLINQFTGGGVLRAGISNSTGGYIGLIANSGTINGAVSGILNYSGTIGTVTNSGTISGNDYGIWNHGGTIGTISNSGLISGPTAIYNTGTVLSAVGNTGTISGNINVNQNLVVTGGNSATIGTLMGHGAVTGTITASNLIFDSNAYQLLDDNVSVGSGTVTNSGVLQINAAHSITGDYVQESIAGLVIGVTSSSIYGDLVISGNASMADDIVTITPLTGSLSAGETFTIVQDAGTANYSSITAALSSGTLPHGYALDVSSISGMGFDDLLVTVGTGCQVVSSSTTVSSASCVVWSGAASDLTITSGGFVSGATTGIINNGAAVGTLTNDGTVGGMNMGLHNLGTIAAIVNDGTISAPTAIYSRGTILSALTNSGVIAGDINVNQNLVVTGGNTGAPGTLTGYNGTTGTITASNLVFDNAAHQLLDDDVNVGSGSGTVSNSGTIWVNATHTITGNYAQGSMGALVVAVTSSSIYGDLVISGNASMADGDVTITPLNGSLTANEVFTIVQDSGAANYASVTATAGGTLPHGYALYVSSINGSGFEDLVVTVNTGCQVVNSSAALSSATCVVWGGVGSNLTITSGGVVSGATSGIINNGTAVGALTNNGTISGTSIGVYNAGMISTILNASTISGGSIAIDNVSGGTIGTIINSGRIIGPTAIYSQGTILGAVNNRGTINGNINVSQPLTITGSAGALIGATITASNLMLDSGAYQWLDDDVIVGAGSGTVTNSGTLKMTASHSISGSYAQGSGAVLFTSVTDATHYGNLTVTGDATMTSGHVSIGGTLSAGERFTIVQDGGTADYSGVTATVGSGFTGSVSSISGGGFNDLVVALNSNGGGYAALGQQAGGGAAPAVGAALDQIQSIIGNGGDASFAPILSALDALGAQSGAAEGEGIKQLAPNQIGPQLVANGLLANEMADMIGQHQEALLSGEPYASTGMAAGDVYQMAPGSPQTGVFWGQAGGGFANRATTSMSAGYTQSLYGLAVGADDHIDRDTTAGLAFSWAQSGARGIDDLSGNTVSVNSLQLTTYGTKRMGPGFINAMAGMGYNMFTERRNIGFLGSLASANYDGMQYMGKIDGGWDFPQDGNITLTPLAGFQAVHIDTDSYTETGAGAANASVGQQTANIFTTTLGGKIATTLPTAWGLFTPELKLLWEHDLTHGTMPTAATLGGVSFVTQSPRAAQDGAQLSLALTLRQDDAFSARLEYDGDLRDGYQAHTGLVKFSWDF